MNYFIEYKYLTDLVLDEVVETKHSAKFIDRILISTQPYENYQELQNDICHLRNILIIKFEISHYFDHCQAHEIKDFFVTNYLPPYWTSVENNADYFETAKIDIAFKKTEEIIENISDRLYFFEKKLHKLGDADTNIRQPVVILCIPAAHLNLTSSAEFSCTSEELRKRKKELKKQQEELRKNKIIKDNLKQLDQDNSYYNILRRISENKTLDNISKYVILYSLLIEKFKTQSAVDNKIEEFSSYRRTEIRKDKPDERVTKITWLRNEIGHTSQKDFDLTKLQKEINKHLNPLFEILKKVLVKYVFDK